jgi:tetratricopeptide (TPR) repeat protein
VVRPAAASRPTIKVRKADLERAELLVTYGDRLFRVANLKRAEERYEQAIRLNPHWATPRHRLAQIALVRGKYPLAADLLREAETAEPGWIVTAKDVQALYAEPADFARHVARLEEHLHRHPEDRDAWLVLGAQWFLSRRENKAADVFLRLDDPRRKPDVALAAFLDAARLREEPKPAATPEPGRDPLAPPAP